jgi:predicted acyl esterase
MLQRCLLPTACCLSLALVARLGAQCSDPVPPRNGFPVRVDKDFSITFSDAYRTKANTAQPEATPGPCGWPLAVLVPGLSENRSTPSYDAGALSSQGFFVVTYDVRGQSEALALNPGVGSRLWAIDEWIDLAEIIEWAAASHPGKVDKDRVGVFGNSQGGLHAWAAAAYSGKQLPANPRRSKPFPTIKAAVPRFFMPTTVNVFTPDTTSFNLHLPALAYEISNPIALLDIAYRRQLEGLLDGDDPAALATYLRQVPGQDFAGELKTSQVPILAVLSWRDTWSDPNGVFSLLASMPATTPKRLFLTTGYHGLPLNNRELLRHILMTESWFRRFLKNDPDPIELGPPILSSVLPADYATYADVTSLWRQRADVAWPPPNVAEQRWHLRSQARLTRDAPAKTEGHDEVKNTVLNSYSVRSWHADGGSVANVLQNVPLSSFSYTTPAFTEDVEIAGLPVVSLAVQPASRNFLIGVRLLSVSPSQATHVLTTGAAATRLTATPQPMRLRVELGALGCVLPQGYALRLEVRNHDIQKALASETFRRLPIFETTSVRVEHHEDALSWLDLPLRPRVAPDIATAAVAISVSDPSTQPFLLRSSPAYKNGLYVVLLGASGQGPPLTLPDSSKIWLAPDVLTTVFAGMVNGPMLVDFAGVLDSQGEGRCRLDLRPIAPLPPGIIGVFLQVVPFFYTARHGFEGGAPIRLRFY